MDLEFARSLVKDFSLIRPGETFYIVIRLNMYYVIASRFLSPDDIWNEKYRNGNLLN